MSTGRWLLALYSAVALMFLILPILAIIPMSLNPTSFLVMPHGGLSARWYRALAESPAWRRAFGNSLLIATCVAVIATPLGTFGALGIARMRARMRGILLALVVAPMAVPVVISAVAFYFLFAPLGLINSLAGMIIAHVTLAVPFVVIVVMASLHGFDVTLLRAGASLGAPPFTVMLRILVPLIAPGVTAGAVFAFMTSFDETVVAMFIAGPAERTLPLQIFEGVREQVSPAITAAATLLIIASCALLGFAELLRRRGERLSRGSAD